MKILINYADHNFLYQQKLNSKFGKKYGGFDKVIEYGPSKLSTEFKRRHASFISQNQRGAGYWIWKPYIILDALVNYANDGDYIFYCDSGSIFINSVDHLITSMEQERQNIFLTEIPLLEYQWTKKECFDQMNCEGEKYWFSNQVQGTYIMVKKSDMAIRFVKDYLSYCEQYTLLDDSIDINCNSQLIDHRHDQSILSLLAKKENIKLFRDISQYGIRPFQYLSKGRDYLIKSYNNSSYPQITLSFRKERWQKVYLKEKVKDLLGFRLRI